MRKIFHQYFRPTETELRELWDDGLFSFDASVLLNIYGYSKDTREDVVDFIEKNAERIRLPHQFGLEYARNRTGVIAKQVSNHQKMIDELKKIRETYIAKKSEHPFLSNKSARAYEAILKELDEGQRAVEKLIAFDPFAEKLFRVMEGKIGSAPTPDQLAALETTAKERYEKQKPPGFADLKQKEPPHAYGDCIAWLQLMEIAKKEKKGVILVIDDAKDDWWLIEHRRTIGPRPELLEEFVRVTQQRFYMFNSESFLRNAKQFAEADIGEKSIEEVSMRIQRQLEVLFSGGPKGDPVPAISGGEKATFEVTEKPDQAKMDMKSGSPPPNLEESKQKGRDPTNESTRHSMAVRVFTDYPTALLDEIKVGIRAGSVKTWQLDTDGDLTHSPEQWRKKAWIRPRTEEDKLVFNILGPKGRRMSSAVYAVYHGRLIEMLLRHFDQRINWTSATAFPVDGDLIGNPSDPAQG